VVLTVMVKVARVSLTVAVTVMRSHSQGSSVLMATTVVV
jgi:hypothetical protein